MGLEPNEQNYVYDHLWRPMELLFEYDTQGSMMDRFFRDYLTMKITRACNARRRFHIRFSEACYRYAWN